MTKRGNRGLSTIVATLLIILLVLVAVGVIWVVVKNIIQQNSEKIMLERITINLEISKADVIDFTHISVVVKRNPGRGEFSGIVFISYDTDNSELNRQNVSLEELKKQDFEVLLSVVNTSEIKKVAIAPIFITKSGEEFFGDIEDEYIFSEQITLSLCGDGVTHYTEGCDDGDLTNGDGCSDTCVVESGWICNTAIPNVCTHSGSGADYIWTGELLLNGGFENYLINWNSAPDFYVTTESPQSGTYAIYYQSSSNIDYYIRQDVNLASWASYINSGTAVITAVGYYNSLEYPNHDIARIQVFFLNSAKGIIGAAALDTGYISDENWQKAEITNYPIPENTRYVRVWGNTYDPDGGASGSLDSFSVMLGYTE